MQTWQLFTDVGNPELKEQEVPNRWRQVLLRPNKVAISLFISISAGEGFIEEIW